MQREMFYIFFIVIFLKNYSVLEFLLILSFSFILNWLFLVCNSSIFLLALCILLGDLETLHEKFFKLLTNNEEYFLFRNYFNNIAAMG